MPRAERWENPGHVGQFLSGYQIEEAELLRRVNAAFSSNGWWDPSSITEEKPESIVAVPYY